MKARTNTEWLSALTGTGETQNQALSDLRRYLLRAAAYALRRHGRGASAGMDPLAEDSAQEALSSLLQHLHEFRGASRFTTWAYKFALLEAAVKLRKRAWQGRELPLEPESWTIFASGGLEPSAEVEQRVLLAAVERAIDESLTRHQRRVLVALAVNGVPIDVLAERLNTNRNALYKTLHDARRKLRRHLDDCGLSLDGPPKEN